MFKKIVNFVKTKLSSAVADNLSPEDQFKRAADLIIDQIVELQRRHVTATAEIANAKQTAEAKLVEKARKDKEIIHLRAKGSPVEFHVRLAILYQRTADAMLKKADTLADMLTTIEKTVVTLDEQREELKVKLEFIREAKLANSMGINTEEDVMKAAGLTQLDVNEIMMRVDTFTNVSTDTTTTTDAEIAEYLDTLK